MKKTTRRRGWSIISVLIIAILVVVAVLRWNDLSARAANLRVLVSQPQYLGGLDSTQTMIDFVGERPGDVGLASYTVGSNGQPVGDAIFHNADEPMPLASTMKIVVLAAYAQTVARGQINPQQPVALADWERFYLPNSDGGAHAAALEELQLAAGERGFAQNGQATVPLDRVVWAMIRYSDNAATDYLLDQLGGDSVQAVITAAGLQGQEPIRALDGTFLSWDNHEQQSRIERVLALDDAAYAQEVARLHELYGQTDWRAAELSWRTSKRPVSRIEDEAQLGARSMPKGTVRDYARIMAGVVSGSFLSPEVSATMRTYLEWPMQKPGNQQRFSGFGVKGGAVAGVLTEAMFVVSKQGDFGGQPRVVVLFLRNLPAGAWLRLTQTFAQQDLAVAIASERPIAEQVAQRLGTQVNTTK